MKLDSPTPPIGTAPSGPPVRVERRRRVASLVLSGLLAISAAAGLAQGLASCQPAARTERSRPLSGAEAARLAGMRIQNYRDGRTALRATIGRPGRSLQLTGWVDWRQPLAYLAIHATSPAQWAAGSALEPFRRAGAAGGPVDGLVQAAPGVLASRPGLATGPGAIGGSVPSAGTGMPPATPPGDGWTVRPMRLDTPAQAPLDAFAALLFTIASDHPDAAELLLRSEARWMGHERTRGIPVDILLGPAVPPSRTAGTRSPAPTSLARMGGAVRYWLDHRARLHRLEALLARDLPVRVDLLREDRSVPAAIPALGGRPVSPRAVTAAEARALSRMRSHNLDTGGAGITISLPGPDGVTRATGWVDWRGTTAYLRLTGPGTPGPGRLLRADRFGVATRPAPARAGRGRGSSSGPDGGPDGRGKATPPNADGAAGRTEPGHAARARGGNGMAARDVIPADPPLPPPTGRAWNFAPWSSRADQQGTYDLELLLNEVLSLSAPRRDPRSALRAAAVWLRVDSVDGRPVNVYELPKPAERRVPPGRARVRYWVGSGGHLVRLELRTRAGGFAQLDLAAGPVPQLPPVPLG